jgi:hypothetical protein
MPWILTRMIMKDQEFEVFFERGIAADDIQKLFQFMVPLIPLADTSLWKPRTMFCGTLAK